MSRCQPRRCRRKALRRFRRRSLEALEVRLLLSGCPPSPPGDIRTAADNVAPTLEVLTLDKSALFESGSLTVSGTFRDPDLTNALSLVIDWGGGLVPGQPHEGTTTITTAGPNQAGIQLEELLPETPGVWRFSASHRYADDDPTLTASDRYAITASVMDDQGGQSDSAETSPGGNIFLTGHRVLAEGPTGFDTLVLDFLRDAGGPSEIPRNEYDIGYLRSISRRAPGDGAFGQVIERDPFEFLGNTAAFEAFLSEIDVLYVPSFIDAGAGIGSVALSASAGAILDFFNRGGDLAVESNDGDPGFYNFLPSRLTAVAAGVASDALPIPTNEGVVAGITESMVGSLPLGNTFQSFGDAYSVFEVVDNSAVAIGLLSGTVRLKNAAPTLTAFEISADTVKEGETITVTGSFTDPGASDTHTVQIDWGAPLSEPTKLTTLGPQPANSTLSKEGSIWRFSATHRYQDDDPTGTGSDVYTVSVEVADDDSGVASAMKSVTVQNVGPSVGGPLGFDATTSVDGNTVRVFGRFVDPGWGDTHTIEIDWGGGAGLPDEGRTTIASVGSHPNGSALLDAGNGTWQFSAVHEYGSTPLAYTVTATVTDDDGGVGSDRTQVIIENGTPILEPLLIDPVVLQENGVVTVTGSFHDPDPNDTHVIEIDWSDAAGGSTTITTAGPNLPGTRLDPLGDGHWRFVASHTYRDDNPSGSPVDEYVITATVEDSRGAISDRRGALRGGNLFVTGHSVLSNDHQFGFDAVILDYLRGAGTAKAIPRTEYDIGYLRDFDHRTPGSGAFGSVTEARPTDFESGTEFAAFLSDVDILYVPWLQHVGDGGSAKLNTFASEIAEFFAAGGDIAVEAGGSLETYYDFLPISVTPLGADLVGATGFTATPAGAAIGITPPMIEGHGYHNHFANPNDRFTIFETRGTEAVSLGLGNDGSDGLPIRVSNVAPQINSFVPNAERLADDGRVIVTGEFHDPGLLDTHSIVIDWGTEAAGQTTLTTEGPLQAGAELSNLGGGNWQFVAEHVYLDVGEVVGSLTISAAVTDDDTGSGSAELEITVEDAPPVLDQLTLADGELLEGEMAVISGQFTDRGSTEHVISVDWGVAGGITTITAAGPLPSGAELNRIGGGVWQFSAAFRYVDDDPTGTASDSHVVTATITNDRDLVVTGSQTITIDNHIPVLDPLALSATSAAENESVTLSGTFFDLGLSDQHVLEIDWGESESAANSQRKTTLTTTAPLLSEASLVALGGGLWEFSASHTYGDDDPTGTSEDPRAISVTVTDDDLGASSSTTSLIVKNRPPEIDAFNLTSASIEEGGEARVTGTFTDAAVGDTHSVVISWGDGTDSRTTLSTAAPNAIGASMMRLPNGSWEFTALHSYAEDSTALGGYTISATVTDDDLGVASAIAELTVSNVQPLLEPLQASAVAIEEDGSVTVTGVFRDPGRLDTHAVVIDWGGDPDSGQTDEGTTTFTTAGVGLGNSTSPGSGQGNSIRPRKRFRRLTNLGDGSWSFIATHQYVDDNPTTTPVDTYTITATVRDDEGAVEFRSLDITVSNRAPQIEAFELSRSSLSEGDDLTVSGEFIDARLADTHVVQIDWGFGPGGQSSTTLTTQGPNPAGTSLIHRGAGRWSFAATRTYSAGDTPAANPIVTLTVSDDDSGLAVATRPLEITNSAPLVESLSLSEPRISEAESVVLTGVFVDSELADRHAVVIDWGTGRSTSLTTAGPNPAGSSLLSLGEGRWQFTAQQQYLDDDPSGTTEDLYSIEVTITDESDGAGAAEIELVVENVSPTAGPLVLSHQTAFEGDTISASGTFFDPGPADTHIVLIDWGDGGEPTSENVVITNAGGGSWNYAATRVLRDDHPTATGTDEATVTASITDDDLGLASSSATISVNDIGPTIRPLEVDAAILGEGGTLVLSGTFVDPGIDDTHTIVIDWNAAGGGRPRRPAFIEGTTTLTTHGPNPAGTTLVHLGNGEWSFEAFHRYRDDNPTATPSDDYLITVEVLDDDTVSHSTAVVVTVANLAPEIDPGSVVVDFPQGEEARVGERLTVSASFIDLGILDLHDIVIDWGDGDSSDTRSSLSSADFLEFDLSGGGFGSFTAQHVYYSAGTFQVRVTVFDDDGGTDDFVLEIMVAPVDSSAAALSDELLDVLAKDAAR